MPFKHARLSSLAATLALAAPMLALANSPPAAAAPEQAKPAPYQDRVLSDSPQDAQAIAEEIAAEQANRAGRPRGLKIDLQFNSIKLGGAQSRNAAIAATGFYDTQDYGSLSVNVNTSRALSKSETNSKAAGTLWRIDQRNMPFDGGWWGSHSIGNVNAIAPSLARAAQRVFLPAGPLEGVVGLYQNDGTELNVSAGRAGLFSGRGLESFSQSQGSLFSFGGQRPLWNSKDGRVDGAVQANIGRNLSVGGSAAENVQSLYLTSAWQGRLPWAALADPSDPRRNAARAQLGVIVAKTDPADSSNNAQSLNAIGLWTEAAWRTTWLRHTATAFYFEPNLRWGASSLASDVKGLDYRTEVTTRQWSMGASAELSQAVQNSGSSAFFGSLFGRRELTSAVGISGTLTARTGTAKAQGVTVSVDHTNRLGNSQWRASAINGDAFRASRAGLDHQWALGSIASLSTGISYELDQRRDVMLSTSNDWQTKRYWVWNIVGSMPFRLGSYSGDVSATIGGSSRDQLATRAGFGSTRNASVQLNMPLTRQWFLNAQYTRSDGSAELAPTLVSALTTATTQPIEPPPTNGSWQIALRYDFAAGAPSAPISALNGRGSGGAGSLVGVVFFDQNNDGVRQADERGVAGVGVLLNGRFSTQTGSQGRYEFSYVAAGDHRIEVIADNVPLPWAPKEREPVQVKVIVRDKATFDFALQR